MSEAAIPYTISTRPRVIGIVILLGLTGVLGIISGFNTVSSMSSLPIGQIWPLYVGIVVSLGLLISAVLIYQYKRLGLALGLLFNGYTIGGIFVTIASTLLLNPNLNALSVIFLVELALRILVALYLVKYITSDISYFS